MEIFSQRRESYGYRHGERSEVQAHENLCEEKVFSSYSWRIKRHQMPEWSRTEKETSPLKERVWADQAPRWIHCQHWSMYWNSRGSQLLFHISTSSFMNECAPITSANQIQWGGAAWAWTWKGSWNKQMQFNREVLKVNRCGKAHTGCQQRTKMRSRTVGWRMADRSYGALQRSQWSMPV